jgi:CRP/FNR family transcriptional regulator, nitrogen oxide reductase regulator
MSTEGTRGPKREPASGAAPSANSNLAEHLVLMCASALFTGLSQRECSEIASCARARTFARDELLFNQGQPVQNLILLESGSVKLTQLSPGGNEVLLWMSGSGDAVNPNAGPTSCSHTCSARAMERCNALVWEYQRLQALLNQYPQIRKNISRILAGRLEELEERFREVSTEPVARRLARTLLRLMKQIGKPSKHGVQVSLTREELAQMTGSSLFTISRVLSKWAEQGFVQPIREGVVVSDPGRLESVSDDEDVK